MIDPRPPAARRRAPLVALLLLCLAPLGLDAQQTGTLTGLVRDLDGRPLSGVQVFIPALTQGSLTNADGRFLVPGVPAGQHELRFERLGYVPATEVVSVTAGESTVVNLTMEMRAISMEGIVATGVVAETPRSQLPFTVARVDVEELQRIPAPSVGGLLQGKVAGAKVVQGSGQPGSEPSFQLRGPTSISGSQEPLVVIDGIISRGGIGDLNPQDIASIEVVKGAAAAALYGSRAQAGVIQVQTRTGSRLDEGSTQFTFRSTYEVNDIERSLGFNRSHPYRLTPDGTAFLGRNGQPVTLPASSGQIAFDDGGAGTNARKSFADKPFPGQTFDPIGQFFNPGDRFTNNISVAGNQGRTQFFISAGNVREEGAITLIEPLKQRNVRVNLMQPIGENIRLQATTFFSDRQRSLVDQQGGLLRALTFITAAADLMKKDPVTGKISHIGDPILAANVTANPINRLVNTKDIEDRVRVMGGFDVAYSPLNWLTFEGNLSYDRIDTNRERYERPGLLNLNGPPTVGSLLQTQNLSEELNTSVTVATNRRFGELMVRNRARWLVESQRLKLFRASGSGLPVDEVPRLGILTGASNIDSSEQTIRSEGFFLINSLTYADRYITDFLVRRDGSSLFGEDERWQTYWRFSGAWRISQEPWFNVPWLNEFKPRYSIGTSGGRPNFSAQYQTYAIDRGQVLARTLGNRNLRPELATEQEFGLDLIIAERFQVELNYVDTKVEDQLLLVPLASPLGFEAQWRNAGTIESQTWELGIETSLIERPGLRWSARLNLDRTTNEITELNIPPYEITNSGSSRARLLVQEGESLGSFFGFSFYKSCADLPAAMPCNQFDVNDYGHLVWVGEGNSWRDGIAKDLWGTSTTLDGQTLQWGHPIRPAAGDPLSFVELGNSQPDLNASIFQDLQWRNLGVSFLLDSEFGAQVYNMTMQWQCRDALCRLADQRGVPDELKKPMTYFGALQSANAPNDFFTEDADYVKIRELSLRYMMRGDNLPGIFARAGLSEVTLNLIGRNLKTWTDYRGFDPEVGVDTFGGSAAVGRVDEWFYPNFRSLGIDLQLVF